MLSNPDTPGISGTSPMAEVNRKLRFRFPRWQGEGGGRELMALALPLILTNSFWTLQITIDRVLLSQYSSDAVAAAMPAAVMFWTPLVFLQNISNYVSTFVAQYRGAGRVDRIGPAVWQGLYFSVVAGIAFWIFIPLARPLFSLADHPPAVQALEIDYFQTLCLCALPTLILASTASFFTGRGDSWTVLFINAVGLAVNAPLAYAWIHGHFGFPSLGIRGAGLATLVGSSVSALLALFLFLRKKHRDAFQTLSGWRWERDLFYRLMRFGGPNGLQWMMDTLSFSIFLMFVGRLGRAELSATSIAFSINLVAVLPMLGLGQAVEVMVGQRQGERRPDIGAKSTWSAFVLAWTYMGLIAFLYAFTPGIFLMWFENGSEVWPEVRTLVPVLLRFVAVYSLFDSMNMVFSFALRGAGDTRFVTVLTLVLAWPILVGPTYATWYFGWGLYRAWTFASAYVITLGMTFLLRFQAGKWRTMRVIEEAPESAGETKLDSIADSPEVAEGLVPIPVD